jgi:hypothetical protein
VADDATLDSQRHPAPARARVALAALVFGAAAAPFFWNLHLLTSVAVTSHACFPGREPLASPIWSVWWITFALAVFGILVSIAALVVSVRSWHETRGEKPGSATHLVSSGDGRTRFIAMCGILTSCLFLVALGFAMLAIFLAPICEL